jgi:hypothetical protein
MSELSLLEKLVLDEISGKNRAIHAYDRMMWTTRSGFLTLFFAGWGVLLKALVEKPSREPSAVDNRILLVTTLVSVMLGIGGLVVDLNYARRKFRVIYALDRLMSGVLQRHGQVHEGLGDIEVCLQVSGDKGDENYRKVSGYSHEAAASRTIYLLPMAVAMLAVYLLWR